MEVQDTELDDEGAPWEEFAGRHVGHPFLTLDPLYAMPERLIDLIASESPGLFLEDERFERDLSLTTGGGIFFHHHLLVGHTEPGPLDNPRSNAVQREIREPLAEKMQAGGLNKVQVDRYFQDEAQRRQDVNSRLLAYTGWLVSNKQFRAERDALRTQGDQVVVALGRFPTHARSYPGELPELSPPEHEPFLSFYDRWALERLLTWDLPIPMLPELHGVTTHDAHTLAAAGVNVFVPWPLLKDRWLTLQDLTKHLKTARNPEHLRGWLTVRGRGQSDLGYTRYRTVLVLYCYWHLVLAARYGNRLKGNTERLDRAFAKYVGRGEESVKKLRIKTRF
jgi:hypothetical protein